MIDKIAVHLPTQEDYDKYMSFTEKQWYIWMSCSKPTELDIWKEYKENTCIRLHTSKLLSFWNLLHYISNRYRIISIEDVMREEAKPEFVRGEVVEVSSYEGSDRYPAKYYDTIEWETYPYIAKALTWIQYHTWECIRKLPQVQEGIKKFTREEIRKYADEVRESYTHNPVVDNILEDFCRNNGMLEE